MRIYVGDYWVDFPMSEYGGMWSVVAANDDEAFTVLKNTQSDFYGDELDDDIRKAITEAKWYELSGNFDRVPHVVKMFTT